MFVFKYPSLSPSIKTDSSVDINASVLHIIPLPLKHGNKIDKTLFHITHSAGIYIHVHTYYINECVTQELVLCIFIMSIAKWLVEAVSQDTSKGFVSKLHRNTQLYLFNCP